MLHTSATKSVYMQYVSWINVKHRLLNTKHKDKSAVYEEIKVYFQNYEF